MFSLEMDKRTARVRRLAGGGAIVYLPETGETFIGMNIADRLDGSRASRLSRGAVHRLVDALTDANAEQKSHYHKLIDEEVNTNVM